MRKKHQHLFSLFLAVLALISGMCNVCLGEERRGDNPPGDVADFHTFQSPQMPDIDITGKPIIIFNYQVFTAGILSSFTSDDLDDRAQKNAKIFFLLEINTILSPTLTIYRDMHNDGHWPAVLNISHSYEFNNNVSLKSSASAGYLNPDETPPVQSFNARQASGVDNYDGTISVSLPIAVSGSLSVVPTLTYAFPLGGNAARDLRDRGLANPLDKSSSFVYGGLSLRFSF